MQDLDIHELAALVAAEVARQLRVSSPPAPVATPSSFRREGDYWTLAHAGKVVRVRDCRGMHHLAVLLRRPNEQVHVLELTGGVPVPRRGDSGCGLEVLDPEAKRAYRRRLAELDGEVRDAKDTCDLGRRERAEQERDLLLQELRRAVGLGGRDRTTADPVERARVAVTKAIRTAVTAVDGHHPELGRHLSHTVRTGTYCTYSAEAGPDWDC